MDDVRRQAQMDKLLFQTLTRAGNGIDVPVSPGAGTLSVACALVEQDARYGVSVTCNWLTTVRVVNKTTTGFDIEFGTVAPAAATLDYWTFRQE